MYSYACADHLKILQSTAEKKQKKSNEKADSGRYGIIITHQLLSIL